ncbi:hypothetical protein, partial [Pseudomonas sp.]|uniref:hypothetical protein n=1 Tax=Pseudomonas sp. TaxID=306 RepID=UPI0028AC733F
AITHPSNNSSRDGLGRSAVFFMLSSDGGHAVALGVLNLPGIIHLRGECLGASSTLIGFFALGAIALPRPASSEPAPGDE